MECECICSISNILCWVISFFFAGDSLYFWIWAYTQSPSMCQLVCPLGYWCNDGSSPAPAFPLFLDVKFSLKSTATNQPVRSKVGNALAAAAGIDSNRVKYLNTSYDIISQRRLSDIQGLEYLTVYFQVDCDISNMATTVQSALQSQTSTLPAQWLYRESTFLSEVLGSGWNNALLGTFM